MVNALIEMYYLRTFITIWTEKNLFFFGHESFLKNGWKVNRVSTEANRFQTHRESGKKKWSAANCQGLAERTQERKRDTKHVCLDVKKRWDTTGLIWNGKKRGVWLLPRWRWSKQCACLVNAQHALSRWRWWARVRRWSYKNRLWMKRKGE